MKKPLKVLFIFSPGGHLRELEEFKEIFAGDEIVYVTDDTALGREVTSSRTPCEYIEVYGWNPVKFCKALFQALRVMYQNCPDVLFSCGAEPAIPFFWLSPFFRVKTIFFETVTRFDKPTLTGRAVYFFSDVFLVLHEELLQKYGKRAVYKGSLI